MFFCRHVIHRVVRQPNHAAAPVIVVKAVLSPHVENPFSRGTGSDGAAFFGFRKNMI